MGFMPDANTYMSVCGAVSLKILKIIKIRKTETEHRATRPIDCRITTCQGK